MEIWNVYGVDKVIRRLDNSFNCGPETYDETGYILYCNNTSGEMKVFHIIEEGDENSSWIITYELGRPQIQHPQFTPKRPLSVTIYRDIHDHVSDLSFNSDAIKVLNDGDDLFYPSGDVIFNEEYFIENFKTEIYAPIFILEDENIDLKLNGETVSEYINIYEKEGYHPKENERLFKIQKVETLNGGD